MKTTTLGWGLALGLLLVAGGCDSKRETSGGQGAGPKGTAVSSGSPERADAVVQKETKSESAAAGEKAIALSEKDVRALVDRWLQAQNSGKFEDYEKLFAERFEGVKRVGSQRESFDKGAWLADRRGMFKGDFTVKVDDLQIAASETTAIVQFIQTWTSATFQDKGPKRLVVVQGKDGLEIAKEEMLQSTLAGKTEERYEPDVRDFAFVWGNLLLVQELEDLKAVQGHPAPTSSNTTSRPVEVKLLPEKVRSLVGEKFVLYGKDGKLCTAKVKSLRVHVELQPHFGQEQRWDGTYGHTKTPDAQRALQLWELSSMGGRFLAAELDIPPGCSGASYARSAARPTMIPWKSRKPSPDEERAILAVVRAQHAYREEQAAFQGHTGDKFPWEESDGGSYEIKIFSGPAGAEYVDVTMFHTGGGCGAGFEGLYWTLLKKKGETYLPVNDKPETHVDSAWPRLLKSLRSDAAFDMDGDGIPEFFGSYDLIKSVGGKFRAVYNLSPAYFDCPC